MSHQFQGAPESLFYYQLLHADEAPEVLPTAFQRASAVLQAADGPAPPSLPHALRLTSFDTFAQDVHDARKWWPGMIDELAHGLAAVTPQKCAEVFLHEAPLALLSGCWLQNVSSAATAHEEIPAAMLGIRQGNRRR